MNNSRDTIQYIIAARQAAHNNSVATPFEWQHSTIPVNLISIVLRGCWPCLLLLFFVRVRKEKKRPVEPDASEKGAYQIVMLGCILLPYGTRQSSNPASWCLTRASCVLTTFCCRSSIRWISTPACSPTALRHNPVILSGCLLSDLGQVRFLSGRQTALRKAKQGCQKNRFIKALAI